jgi:hypothetical protein
LLCSQTTRKLQCTLIFFFNKNKKNTKTKSEKHKIKKKLVTHQTSQDPGPPWLF